RRPLSGVSGSRVSAQVRSAAALSAGPASMSRSGAVVAPIPALFAPCSLPGSRLDGGISPSVGGFRCSFFGGRLFRRRCDVFGLQPAGLDAGGEDHGLRLLAADIEAIQRAFVLHRLRILVLLALGPA